MIQVPATTSRPPLPADFAPHIEKRQASLTDRDQATRETVEEMGRQIRETSRHPYVVAAVQEALDPLPETATQGEVIQSVFDWVRARIKFAQDQPKLDAMGYPDGQDYLTNPPMLLSMPNPTEDCDGFTMLAGAMLHCLSIPYEIVTIAAEPDDPARFSHVYGQTQLGDGRRIVMDCSHGLYLGWEADRQYRRQVWDLNGNPIQRSAPTTLHGYGYGMGDDPSSGINGDLIDTGSFDTGGGGFDWGGLTDFGSTALNDITKIITMPRPGEYVQTAQGTRSYQVPGAVPGMNYSVGTSGGISTSMLMIGGIALLAIMAMGKK